MNGKKKYVPKRNHKNNHYPRNASPNTGGTKKRYVPTLKTTPIYLYQLDQRDLKHAIIAAEAEHCPDRRPLHAIYKETVRDLHIKSQIKGAIDKVNAEDWAVVDWNKLAIDKDWTMFLDNEWFEKIGEFVNLEEFWGSTLIEFGIMMENTDERFAKLAPFTFPNVKLVPRDNWIPETGELRLRSWDSNGINIRELGLWDNFLMEIGDPENLGILQDIARVYIFKKFTMGDWSQSSEKWSDPILLIQTASDNDAENDKKMEWATNLSKNRAALMDDQDKLELLQPNSTSGNGHKIYMDFIAFLNDELSKGTNGQTGTTDQKAFVGAAEVHERTMDDYTTARLRKRFYFHNNQTFPFLKTKGFKLDGKSWVPAKFFKRFLAQYSLEPEVNPTPQAPVDPKKPVDPSQAGKGGPAPKK